MKRIRDAVVNAIHKYSGDDDQLIGELDRIVEESGEKRAYSIFFKILTHLDLKPEIAESHWRRILDNRKNMGAKLGREINLRTVICDYFCTIDKTFSNPVVVDIQVFEKHLDSLKFDSLTGLYTRTTFEETIQREISRSKRYENDLSLLFFDIDDFKKVNDTYGHLAGDMILKEISRIVKQEIRNEDFAARYGGEEIVVILPETGKLEGLIIGERIREKVEAIRFSYNGHIIKPTISGGLASFPIDAHDMTDLIRAADDALYRAKGSGKNKVSVYSHDKRRYLRVGLNTSIQLKPLGFDQTSGDFPGKSKNISLAGILLESTNFIGTGNWVQLRMHLDNMEGPLWLIGTVVRVEMFESDRYDLGVSFVDLDKTARNEISRYMIRQLERAV